MNLLAHREHSRTELTRKLLGRGYDAALVDRTVQTLQDEGLLCDERFMESFVAARARRGQGPVRIRMELEQRGLDGARISAYFATLDTDWAEIAGAAREKRFGKARPTEYKERARQARFLQYRGFEADQVRAALRKES